MGEMIRCGGVYATIQKKIAFDVGITFLASVVTLPLGFVITIALGRYIGAGDLGLYRMPSTIYRLENNTFYTFIPNSTAPPTHPPTHTLSEFTLIE